MKICQEVVRVKNIGVSKNENLVSLINTIELKLKPDQFIIEALENFRVLGNQGAHPEQFKFSTSELACQARKSLEGVVTALTFAHTQIHPGQHLPDRIETAPVGDGLKTLSYKATIEEQPEAQYLIGEYFWEKVKELERESDEHISKLGPTMFGEKVHEIRRKAHFWYELAASQRHPQAMYSYGRLLIDGLKGDEYISMGVGKVFMAAQMGNADANVCVGNIYYEGRYDRLKDFVEARNHFEIAAGEDHPAALMMLGIMYQRGEGGPANPRAAFEYTRRSAEAGYPTGQHNLFVHYWNEHEPNEAEAISWLNKAANQGYPSSMNLLASLIAENRIAGKTIEDALHLFEESANSRLGDQQTRNQALFLRAQLLVLHYDDLAKLTSAADTLQRCFESEQGIGELARDCAALSPTVLTGIRKLIQNHKGTAEEITAASLIANYMFDKNGRPLADRDQALQALRNDLENARQAKGTLSPEVYQLRLNRTFVPQLTTHTEKQRLRVVPNTSEKTGRNDPCSCGSGKKHKRCCGR